MFRKTTLVIALGSVISAGAFLSGRYADELNYQQMAASIGVGGRFCLPPSAKGSQNKTFFKLAMAEDRTPSAAPLRNELKPFSNASELVPGAGGKEGEPMLWGNLGKLHYPITTHNELAQKFFDQGLRFAYAFNHAEALRAFRKAQQLDSECAMCYWGEALVLGPNINAPMEAASVAPAVAAIARAKVLAKKASEREQALVQALSQRYSDDVKAERAVLDAAYAGAMTEVAARFPDDLDIAVLQVEAVMDLTPWDYWEAGGSKPKGRTAEMLATLERVLKANPDHAGAIHYYIHMVEASAAPERAVPHAKRLGKLMPGAGHIVHMPFHIFFRLGDYKEALQSNKDAVAADENYIETGAPNDLYVRAYYPHNVHSMMVSAQMAGDGETVIAAADKLNRIVSDETTRNIAWVQPIKVSPYFAHAQFSRAETVLSLADPGDEFPFVKAMWHYARGVALAKLGEDRLADAEAQSIARLMEAKALDNLAAAGVPARDILTLAVHVVNARNAQSQGHWTKAVSEFEQAIDIEDKLAYSEPPYWYYPIRQSLGGVFVQSGDLDRAEQAFRSSLSRAPNNAWALYGLAEVFKQRGDRDSERATRQLFRNAWAGKNAMFDLTLL